MHKLKTILLIIPVVCILNACASGDSRMELLNNTDETNAEIRLKQVVESIKNKNTDELKDLFSEAVLIEKEDFDESINMLFDFIQGDIESWKKSSGPTVFESIDYGRAQKNVSSYYYVTTDKQEYFFLLEECTADTEQPDTIGLSLLLVVKAEDHDKIYDERNKILYDTITENGEETLVKLSHTGIYLPLE